MQEKCVIETKKEELEENVALREILEEYGDTPLPQISEDGDQQHILEKEENEEAAEENGTEIAKNDSVILEEEDAVPQSSAGNEKIYDAPRGGAMEEKRPLELEEANGAFQIDRIAAPNGEVTQDAVPREGASGTVTKPSAPGFVDLQQQLEQMEPYFKVQQQLKEIVISDTPSASVCAGEHSNIVQYGVSERDEYGDGVVREQYGINSAVAASAPLLSPESAVEAPVDGEHIATEYLESVTAEQSVRTKVILAEDAVIQPMTDVQITSLYQNNELEENAGFIAHFIEQEQNIPQLEFYELVLGYLRARTSLIGSQKELVAVQEEYKKQKGNIWIFEKRTATEEGECEDERMLTVTHEYKVACFKEEIALHVYKQLKQSREILSNSYALHAYEAEMCKLQVENYMQKVFSKCPDFMQISKDAGVYTSGSKEQKPHLRPHVENLRICISVLFAFQRRGVKDQRFVRDTRQWLTDLVAMLQRVATRHDHLFILNHVLRCPAGVGTWAPAYIQVVLL